MEKINKNNQKEQNKIRIKKLDLKKQEQLKNNKLIKK